MQLSSNHDKDPLIISPFEKFMCGLTIIVFLFAMLSTHSYRYTIPDNRYIIQAETTQLGTIDILVPIGSRNYFRLSGSTPVNISSSTVTCYFNRNNQEYTVRWTQFNTAEYRLSAGNNTWQPLTITGIGSGTTVQFLSELDTSQLSDSSILNICFLAISVFICYLLLRRPSR